MQLSFQFENFQAFLAMDGHGPYVWASYALTLLAIAVLALSSSMAKRGFIEDQQAMLRRRKGS